jgi:hypothetical protein
MYVPSKYWRTYHLPQSLSVTDDDKVLKSIDQFNGKNVVVTEKMDGENTTIYCGGTHARSIDGKYHPSRSWMKAYASAISPYLEENEKIVGEYLYARHSIAYDNLDTYFMGFAWFVDNIMQSWELTKIRFDELGIKIVPILYEGIYYNDLIKDVSKTLDLNAQEGFVLRIQDEMTADDFKNYCGKYVRKGHVQTDKHWMHSEIVKNNMKE